jgi:hypothetical protein
MFRYGLQMMIGFGIQVRDNDRKSFTLTTLSNDGGGATSWRLPNSMGDQPA